VNTDKACRRDSERLGLIDLKKDNETDRPRRRTAVSRVKVTGKQRKDSQEILFVRLGDDWPHSLHLSDFRPGSKIEIVPSCVQVGNAIEVTGHDMRNDIPRLSFFSPSSAQLGHELSVMFRTTE